MNVADFIAAFRSDLDDAAEPYLWSDADIIRYLNNAVREACERALLIEDSSTYDAAIMRTVAGQSIYVLHPSVIKIKRVAFRGRPLCETSVEQEDRDYCRWETTTGEPRRYIANDLQIRLTPTPTTAEDFILTVYRSQLEEFDIDPEVSGEDEPEINAIYHARLLDWVYRCAYLKQDAETLNKSKAVDYETKFVAAFGVRPDANVQRKRRDQRPPIVRMNW